MHVSIRESARGSLCLGLSALRTIQQDLGREAAFLKRPRAVRFMTDTVAIITATIPSCTLKIMEMISKRFVRHRRYTFLRYRYRLSNLKYRVSKENLEELYWNMGNLDLRYREVWDNLD